MYSFQMLKKRNNYSSSKSCDSVQFKHRLMYTLTHPVDLPTPFPRRRENADTAISDPKLVAESFNDYFIGIGPELAAESNIDLGDEDPPIHKVNKELQLPSQAHPHQQLRHQTYGVENNGHKQQK